MGYPTVTKTWLMSFNNRYVWNSSTSTNVAQMGAFMFSLAGVGGFLPSTAGYTVKGSCNGTTGAMDGVNRITSPSAWATRTSFPGAAMSWIVLTDGSGVDWLFAYESGSDSTVRLSHSTGGNYAAAATPTNQPTATDECFNAASGNWLIVSALTTRADQVWHLWASSDKKLFRIVTCSETGVASDSTQFGAYIAGETFTSSLISPATFTLNTGGGTVAAAKSYYLATDGATGHLYQFTSFFNSPYAAVTNGDLVRVNPAGTDGNSLATIGGETPGGSAQSANGAWSVDYPALQGRQGYTIFPATIGAANVGFDGKLGNKIDHWYVLSSTNAPTFLTMLGSMQFWAIFPGCVLVGDGATALVQA
jgi:hypothetical protein